MKIECDYTLKEYAEAVYDMKKKPMTFFMVLAVIFFLCGILGFVDELAFKGGTDSYIWYLTAIALATSVILMMIIVSAMPKRFAKKLLKNNPSFKDGVKQSYSFMEDEFEIRESVGTNHGTQTMKYSSLKKARETKNHIFLYVNAIVAYPVRKASLNEEDLKKIRQILSGKVSKNNLKSA